MGSKGRRESEDPEETSREGRKKSVDKVERKGEGDLGKGKVEVGDGAVEICKEEKLERGERKGNQVPCGKRGQCWVGRSVGSGTHRGSPPSGVNATLLRRKDSGKLGPEPHCRY